MSKRKWFSTNFPGVRYREHPARKFKRRPDRYYAIRYRQERGGPQKEEGVGWESEGWTAQNVWNDILSIIKQNCDVGTGPRSLAEMRSQAEAARQLEAEQTRQENYATAPQEITFSELGEMYLKWSKLNKPSSWMDDRTRFRLHLESALGGKRLVEITKRDVEQLKHDLLQKPRASLGKGNLSPATVLQCLTLVRGMFNYALNTPFYDDNPDIMIFSGSNPAMMSKKYARGIKPPKFDNRIRRILTDEQVYDILTHAKSLRSMDMHDIILCALDQGARREEIAAYSGQAISSDKWTIVIDGKGGKVRTTYAGLIHPQSTEILAQRISRNGPGLLFPNSKGKKRNLDHISKMFSEIINDLGINNGITERRFRITFHGCRHKFATTMLESGMDIYSLMDMMGHEALETTKRYLHICDQNKRRRALMAGGLHPIDDKQH